MHVFIRDEFFITGKGIFQEDPEEGVIGTDKTKSVCVEAHLTRTVLNRLYITFNCKSTAFYHISAFTNLLLIFFSLLFFRFMNMLAILSQDHLSD